MGPGTTAFDFTPHLTAIPYLTIPTTSLSTNPTSMTNGNTVVSSAVNALQQKYDFTNCYEREINQQRIQIML
jgi:hypothetical protein